MRQIVIADTDTDGTLSREAFLFSSAHEGLEALVAPKGPAPSSTYYCPKEGGEWTPIEEAPVEIRLRAGRLRNTLEAVGVL